MSRTNIERQLAAAQRDEESMARLPSGEIVLIEKVYLGRDVRREIIRAKVFKDTRVLYVNYYELQVF